MSTVETSDIVNRVGLMHAFGWSRQKLIDELARDPNFPIEKRGSRGIEWEFSLARVRAHLSSRAEPLRERPVGKTASDDDDLTVRALSAGFARMAEVLHRLPTQLAIELGLSPSATRTIRRAMRRGFKIPLNKGDSRT